MGEKKEKVLLNIHQRVNAVMADVNYIKKDKKIEMRGGGYSVTGHDAVTKLVHPLLVKHGINIIPSTIEITQEGNRTRIDLEFRWVNIDNPEDNFITEASGYGIDQQDKGIGKGWSVAQRYTVLKTLHLETGDKDIEEDDIDHAAEEVPVQVDTKVIDDFIDEVEVRIDDADQRSLMKLMETLNLQVSDVIETVREKGYEHSSEIPKGRLEEFKEALSAKAKVVTSAAS